MKDSLIFNAIDTDTDAPCVVKIDIDDDKIASIHIQSLADDSKSGEEALWEVNSPNFAFRASSKLPADALSIESFKDIAIETKLLKLQTTRYRDMIALCILKIGGVIEAPKEEIELDSIGKHTEDDQLSTISPSKIENLKDPSQFFKPLTQGVTFMTNKLFHKGDSNHIEAASEKKENQHKENQSESPVLDTPPMSSQIDEKDKEIENEKGNMNESSAGNEYNKNFSDIEQQFKEELENKNREILELKEMVQKLRTQSSFAETGKALAQVHQLEIQKQALENEKEEALSSVVFLKQRVNDLDNTVKDLKQKNELLSNLENEAIDLKELLEKSRIRENELMDQKASLLNAAAQNEEGILQLKQKVKELEDINKSKEEEIEKIKTDLESSDNEKERLIALNKNNSRKSESLAKDLSKIMHSAAGVLGESVISIPQLELILEDYKKLRVDNEKLKKDVENLRYSTPITLSCEKVSPDLSHHAQKTNIESILNETPSHGKEMQQREHSVSTHIDLKQDHQSHSSFNLHTPNVSATIGFLKKKLRSNKTKSYETQSTSSSGVDDANELTDDGEMEGEDGVEQE